jgi:hypothetical protein
MSFIHIRNKITKSLIIALSGAGWGLQGRDGGCHITNIPCTAVTGSTKGKKLFAQPACLLASLLFVD